MLEMRWLLDRVWLGFLCAMYLAGAAVLTSQLRHADDPVVRRQLTWLRNGAVAGIVPFAAIYVVPYLLGVAPTHAMNLAVLSLPLIPLTWAYAILRYRLMDVDIIFQEGYVYTLATLCVLGIFYGLIFSVSKTGDLSGTAMVALILIAAFVFQPIRNWIQEQLDRYYFYKDRYDYRRTLIEFARELGSPTDMGEMLESVADRLIRTLGIRHVAFFVWNEVRRSLPPGTGQQPRRPQDRQRPLRSGSELPDPESHEAVSVLRAHAQFARRGLARMAGGRAALHRRTGADLLPALLGARPHHRLPGREPHRERRFSVERRRRTAGDAFGLRRHRHRQRHAVPVAGRQGGRVRAAERILRKHRRVDPRRHSGGRSGRSRGKLEFADRKLTGISRTDAVGRKLSELLPAELVRRTGPRARHRQHSQHL